MQQIVSLPVSSKRIGPMMKEKIDNVTMSSLGCPQCWCCDSSAPFGINVSANLDEIFAERIVIVDSRPLRTIGRLTGAIQHNGMWPYMQRCDPFFVLIIGSNPPTVNHILDCCYTSKSCQAHDILFRRTGLCRSLHVLDLHARMRYFTPCHPMMPDWR